MTRHAHRRPERARALRVVMLDRRTAREVLVADRRVIPARDYADDLALSVALDDGSPVIVGTASIRCIFDLAREDVPRALEQWLTSSHREWWHLHDVIRFERGVFGLGDGRVVDGGLLERVKRAAARSREAIGGGQ